MRVHINVADVRECILLVEDVPKLIGSLLRLEQHLQRSFGVTEPVVSPPYIFLCSQRDVASVEGHRRFIGRLRAIDGLVETSLLNKCPSQIEQGSRLQEPISVRACERQAELEMLPSR